MQDPRVGPHSARTPEVVRTNTADLQIVRSCGASGDTVHTPFDVLVDERLDVAQLHAVAAAVVRAHMFENVHEWVLPRRAPRHATPPPTIERHVGDGDATGTRHSTKSSVGGEAREGGRSVRSIVRGRVASTRSALAAAYSTKLFVV